MGAFEQLSVCFRDGIVAVAQRLGYSEANVLIMEGNEAELRRRFPDVYANLLSCGHNKDARTYMEYAQDLVSSWVFEDFIMSELSNAGLEISKAGADRDREILAHANVSADSDYSVEWQGKEVLLELMSDYTGYWTRTGRMDLRDSKYLKLERNESLFLGISTQDRKFIFLDFSEDIPARYIDSHRPYGGKPAYQIHVNEDMLVPFNIARLVETIKAAIEMRD